MKKFETPTFDYITFETEDIIQTSSFGLNIMGKTLQIISYNDLIEEFDITK